MHLRVCEQMGIKQYKSTITIRIGEVHSNYMLPFFSNAYKHKDFMGELVLDVTRC